MIDTNQIIEALGHVPAEDRDLWWRMAAAIKSELGEGGFDLWDDWSKTGSTYKAGDAKDVWKSTKTGGGITISTLFHHAKENGWKGQPYQGAGPEELAQRQAEQKKAAQEDAKKRALAAERAARLYEQCKDAPASAPYLRRKGIQPPAGVRRIEGMTSRVFGFEGREWNISGLIVPMQNKKGEIRSLQFIPDEPEQKKLFLPGGDTSYCFHVLGSLENARRIAIAEGLATAQSVFEATGLPVAVVFSAHNLAKVAPILRGQAPTAEIIVCADDDVAGLKAAKDAMQACGGQTRMVTPGQGMNDFNDLHAAHGLDAVREAILGDEEPENNDWQGDLIIKHRADGDRVIPCRVHNLILILKNAPEFKGRIRYNEFSRTIEVDGKDITDSACARLKAQIEKRWIEHERVNSGEILEALSGLSELCGYHPVKEYLDSLVWDGIPRIEDFFPCFLETPPEENEYHKGVGRAFFVSAVGRIYQPGMKVDLMVILEGAQGIKKSTLWETLGGAWYSDITDDITGKDFQAGLQGVWIADLGELDPFNRAESSRIKTIITVKKDRLRRPYARFHENISRQTVLVGSSNRTDWINDPTGGRRFLPVSCKCSQIDIDHVSQIRDQLWAEAVHRYKHGEAGWWDVPHATDHQAARYNEDVWQAPIEEWLMNRQSTRTTEILRDCLHIELGKQTKSESTRIGNVMSRAGWKRVRVREGGVLVWRYFKS